MTTSPLQNKPQRPILIVVAGPNGSGKTSLASELKLHNWVKNCVSINPDEIAQNEFGDWNSPSAVKKAIVKSQLLREECLCEKKNFMFESVFSAPDKLEFLKKASQDGYFIRFFLISTSDPTINAVRVTQRVMEGGHDVPNSKIISRFKKSLLNSAVALTFVDRGYVYDNSLHNQPFHLLFRTVEGHVHRTYTPPFEWPQWVGPVTSALR
ncbi:MAG: zeta toxin family protein [Deltaproteobacteria bacterium]|jgi:predicted ABC-type ATPase|nr:zeta toxin family protein [Deltaproteobacteria bacterium]